MIEDEGYAPMLADGVGEAKAYLRVEEAGEDAAIAGMIAAAAEVAEGFLCEALFVRGFRETMIADAAWRRLGRTPVQAITGVEAVALDGATTALPVGSYAIDIDAAGDGWVRVTDPLGQRRVAVSYSAGRASSWAEVEPDVRQGIIRLATHLYAHRDAPDDRGPPQAVAALWLHKRRMGLR